MIVDRSSHLPLLLAAIIIPCPGHAPPRRRAQPSPLEGQQPLLTLTGKGVQIYTCQQVDDKAQWVFQAPEATLFDEKEAKVGTHAAGPVWNYQDGSTVKGEVIAKNPAPDPEAIPWLLLRAVSSQGSGLMTRVDFDSPHRHPRRSGPRHRMRRRAPKDGRSDSVLCNVHLLRRPSVIGVSANLVHHRERLGGNLGQSRRTRTSH